MPSKVEFYILDQDEWHALQVHGPIRPHFATIDCGACGHPTHARIVAQSRRKADDATISWVVCACEQEEPSVILSRSGAIFAQHTEAKAFQPGERWPTDLAQLYDEAAKSYAAGAYTAAATIARKLLMVTACREGDADGKPFAAYVDYIINSVLTFPKAKDSIDKIRKIGNEANHSVQMVSRDDAKRAIEIVTYMLNTIYSLPTA